jgi:hypothetical protein
LNSSIVSQAEHPSGIIGTIHFSKTFLQSSKFSSHTIKSNQVSKSAVTLLSKAIFLLSLSPSAAITKLHGRTSSAGVKAITFSSSTKLISQTGFTFFKKPYFSLINLLTFLFSSKILLRLILYRVTLLSNT